MASSKKTNRKDSSLKSNAIVVCCTANWLPMAACTLLSCAQQGAGEIADFYVALQNGNAGDKAKFLGFMEEHGVAVKIVDVTLPEELQRLVTVGASPPHYLIRMNLHNLLPHSYARVLYLDSDILALAPLDPVFNTKLSGKALGAVEDFHSMRGPLSRWDNHTRDIGMASDARYFNSGMMLFDWQETLRLKLLQRSADLWYAKAIGGSGNYTFPDQDALNIGFAGHWQPLPVAMNASSVMVDYFPHNPILRHYSAHYRPWAHYWMPGLAKDKERYRVLIQDSPWPEFEIKKFSTVDPKELAGILLRKVDFITRARYRRHVKSGLA